MSNQTRPALLSITRNYADNTATDIYYTVTFSEPVTGVTADQFSLINADGSVATISQVSAVQSGNGTQYIVDIATHGSVGTVGLDFKGAGIRDLNGVSIAGGDFSETQDFQAEGATSEVAVADINGDGNLDVVSSNYEANTVSVFLGDGHGSFASSISYPVEFASGANEPSSGLILQDINGDGKADIVSKGSVLLNEGDGRFSAPIIYDNGNLGEYSVACGDFNRDGKQDIVVSSPSDSAIGIYLGNGDGTFQPFQEFGQLDNPEAITVADFDRDGSDDVAVSVEHFDGTGGIVVFLNRSGQLVQQSEIKSDGYAQELISADINGDGINDIVDDEYYNDGIAVFLGKGDGTFQQEIYTNIGFDGNDSFPESIATGDFNNDGKLDVSAAYDGQGGPLILFGNGDGTLNPDPTSNIGPSEGVAVGDFDGDGRTDVVRGGFGNGIITIYHNNPPEITGPTYHVTSVTTSLSNAIVNAANVTVTGKVAGGAGLTANVLDNGRANPIGSGTVRSGGAYSIAVTLPDQGDNLLSVSDVDATGDTGVGPVVDYAVVTGGTYTNTRSTTVNGFTLMGSTVVQNRGTIAQNGAVTIGDNSGSVAQVVNQAGATYAIAGNFSIAIGSNAASSFANAGTLSKTAGASVSHVAAKVTDTGTVTVATGSLEFDGTASSFAGAFTGAGRAIFGGGTDAFNAGFSIGTGGWTITGASTAATLNAAQSYGGGFALSGGATLTLAKALMLTGSASVASSKINGTSTLGTSAATTVNGATLAGTVAWTNTGTVTASGALTLGDGAGRKASFTNASNGVFNITGAGGIALGGGTASVFTNAGLLERTVGAATVKIGVKVVSTGTVKVATGGVEFDAAGTNFAGAITGEGIVSFGSSVGATLLAGSSLSAATVSILGTGRLNIGTNLSYSGNLLEAAGGVLSLGANTLTLTGTATIASNVGGSGGTLAVNGGSLTLNGSAALGMSQLALSNGATITANKALATQAAFTESASVLVLNQHALTLAQGASFSAGMIDGAGGGTVAVKGAGILAGGLTLDNKAALALYGTTTETGGLILGDSSGGAATLINAAGARFTIGDDSAIQAAAGGTGKISNAGTLTKSGTSGMSLIGLSVINTGTIAASSGTLNLAGGVLGTGALTVGSGATLELGGPTSTGSTVTFASGGSGEMLQLDEAQAFAGKVAGFGAGDTFDFANIAFSGATLSYADTNSGGAPSGTLTVKSHGTTANLHLLGNYTLANFAAASDSSTTPGTLIAFHA